MSRVVLFGATGYTGRLVARALADQRPLLVGRDRGRLDRLAAELGGLQVAVASSDTPERLRDLLGKGDVLVTTVGPFLQRGQAALDAAIAAGAAYIDSTGEPPFVKRVFATQRADGLCALLTAFGYDFVPGNLAGALALAEAGPEATRVDIGYFLTGRSGAGAASTGTAASIAGLIGEPGFAWRAGRLVPARNAADARTFTVGGRRRSSITVAGSEHFALPRQHPGLRDVGVYAGWFGPASRPLQVASALGGIAGRLGARHAMRALSAALARRTGSGPDEAARARSGTAVVAVATDGGGRTLAEVGLAGPNAYDFTARILAWGAREAAAGLQGTGALGPVDAFGLNALTAGCAEAGLVRV